MVPSGFEGEPGGRNGQTDLSSPEIASWLAGDDSPVLAPRSDARAGLNRVDQSTAECVHPAWSGSPSVDFEFVDRVSGAVLSRGSSRLRVERGQAARDVWCVSVASNGGGVSEALSSRGLRLSPPAVGPVFGLTLSTQNASIGRHGRYADVVGPPVPTVEVSIQGAGGAQLPDGTTGEVCVRGPILMKGYWGKPEATAACDLRTMSAAWQAHALAIQPTHRAGFRQQLSRQQ